MNQKNNHIGILVFNCIVLCFCVVASYHSLEKADLPNYPVIINGVEAKTADEVEFLLGQLHSYDIVSLSEIGNNRTLQVHLQHYYKPSIVLYNSIIAFLIFLTGFIVYFYRPKEQSAIVFHLASSATTMAILGTKTIYALQPLWLGLSVGLVFFISYTIIPVLFFHFTLLFPFKRIRNLKTTILPLYGLAITLAILHFAVYTRAGLSQSIEMFRDTHTIAIIKDGFVALVLALAIGYFLYSYSRVEFPSQQKKLRWILFGLTIGPTPYLLFWVLPNALGVPPIIDETIFKLFLVVIPVAFAISIMKHQIMDIDLLINRGIVYIIVIGIGWMIYIGIVSVISMKTIAFTQTTTLFVSILITTIFALLFEPLRKRMQQFVDRSFFRIQYDFREAQLAFVNELQDSITFEDITQVVVSHIHKCLPTESLNLFYSRNVTQDFQPFPEHLSSSTDVEYLRNLSPSVTALPEYIEPGISIELADREIFQRQGFAVILPLLAESQKSFGILVLGKKKSGLRFTNEDIDLLKSICNNTGLALERIMLQQKLLLEHAETRRLAELNTLKSYFVSGVSHDLKTPLTSIKLFAELLRTTPSLSKEESQKYLQIIEGETERLTRLINNVLDFSKIERGIKEYHFTRINLNEIITHVIDLLQYQFGMERVTLHLNVTQEQTIILGDTDALTDAIINIINNSLKYSTQDKQITISTSLELNSIVLKIADNGIGISSENIDKIFDPFFRSPEGKKHGAGGVGLGLSLVKHIVDAHQGKITVESTPGKGTTFTIVLKTMKETDEQNFNN